MYSRSREILKHISAPALKAGNMDLQQIKQAVSVPGLTTVLPHDFFEAFLQHLPQWQSVVSENNWVQAGVWKGGGGLFLKAVMEDLGNKSDLFLFDTFSDIPTGNLSKAKDIAFVEQFNITSKIASYKQEVINLFERHDLYTKIQLIEGDVAQTAKTTDVQGISLLHIDVDFYEPVLATLQYFHDRLIPGGVIIIDDYFLDYVNCKDAVDEFLKAGKLNPEIKRLSSYAAYFRKPE